MRKSHLQVQIQREKSGCNFPFLIFFSFPVKLVHSKWTLDTSDDILIAGEGALRVLEVLSRLQLEKCLFAVPELFYLGFVVCSEGLKTSPAKV